MASAAAVASDVTDPEGHHLNHDIQNTEAAQRGLSRLLRRRTRRGSVTRHARPASVGSLDRVFDTGVDSSGGNGQLQSEKPLHYEDDQADMNTYGFADTRDSFFDAVFQSPMDMDPEQLLKQAEATLPHAFRKKDPLSVKNFLPRQWHEVQGVARRVCTTRAGIKLAKSFLGFFIAYCLCLVPVIRTWLGRYSYIMAVSTIINHSGRTLGAQVDGAILTILGTALGIGWGAFALWLSTSSSVARVGFGGVLAAFLFLFVFVAAFIRSYYIRTHQMVICAGIAISYTCLAEVSGTAVQWPKLVQYIIPWCLGQAIALLVCFTVAPDAGARPLAVALHQAFEVMQDGLLVAREENKRTRRRLAQTFVNISGAYRDLIIDFSVTRVKPSDVLVLRNLIQGVIRSLLSLKNEKKLFDFLLDDQATSPSVGPHLDEYVIDMGEKADLTISSKEKRVLDFIANNLVDPIEHLLGSMRQSLQSCDAVLMEQCGHRKYLGPPSSISNDVSGFLVKLRKRLITFSEHQDSVLASNELPPTYAEYPNVVKLFAFCRQVHQAAVAIEALLVKVNQMEQEKANWPRIYLPRYPIWKALHRSNAQVRHDRGGVTAGSYFRSFSDIADIIQKIRSRNFDPLPRQSHSSKDSNHASYATMTATELEDDSGARKSRLRHRIWAVLHRLQGFETKFSLKVAAVTSLLAIPAWLSGSRGWWNDYEAWWAVVMAWLIMGPRTGGNVQDLIARVLGGILGSLWGGLAVAARGGNPFVTGAFALIFMLPALYRFTQSTHPRSGFVACISFTVVSLADETAQGYQSTAVVAASRGAAIVVGVVAAVIVNWILWPFVARHDLRKAMSSMMFYCSIVYRSIVSKYVYYEEGHEPTKEDIEASEILEGRLREGFVRLRQLLGLTRHEIRLRAPFDPLPYSALIDACEQFFDYIVTVRQSSQFYHPHFIRDNSEASSDLLIYRRDAIATVLSNLYVLSGALRADRKVPKYLPSAAAARKHLLDRTRELEAKYAASGRLTSEQKAQEKKWSQIYSYSYNESLTGCVEQLVELEKYTKAVVGEQGFDCGFAESAKR